MSRVVLSLGSQRVEVQKQGASSVLHFAERPPTSEGKKRSKLLLFSAFLVSCALWIGLISAHGHYGDQISVKRSLATTRRELATSTSAPLPSSADSAGIVDVVPVASPYTDVLHSLSVNSKPPTIVDRASGIVDVFHVSNPSSSPTIGSAIVHETPTASPHAAKVLDLLSTSRTPSPALRGSSGAQIQSPTTSACLDNYPAPPPLPGKKGVCLLLRAKGEAGSWVENLPKVLLLNPYWNYSWGMKRVDAQPDNIEFVPMVWGGSRLHEVKQNLKNDVLPHIVSGKVKRIFGFNEPDNAYQANMSVRRALRLWSGLESMNLPLTSTSCVNPAGEWMNTFMANATATCRRVDWMGVHWYGNADFASFVNSMTEYHKQYRRPIVITEFAPADWDASTVAQNENSPATVLAFMKQALPWLEAQDWIVGYAWFSFDITSSFGTSSALFDEGGKLTACGRFYASVRTDNPQGDQSI
jgi:hypothetical protein